MVQPRHQLLGRVEGVRHERPDGRWYRWQGPAGQELYLSVTTIISSGVPKKNLPYWAARSVAERAAELLADGTLARLLADHGGNPAPIVALLKEAPWEQRDAAADRGSRVHDAAERAVLRASAGLLDEEAPDPDVAPYLDQWRRWCRDYGVEFWAAEAPVFSRRFGYAGTADAIVERDGRRYLVDYKTNEKGLYPEVALQLSAYAHADFIGLPDGTEHPMPELAGALAVNLQRDQYVVWELDRELLARHFHGFLCAFGVAEWSLYDARELRERMGRNVHG